MSRKPALDQIEHPRRGKISRDSIEIDTGRGFKMIGNCFVDQVRKILRKRAGWLTVSPYVGRRFV
jgi:hypothetical protein